MERKAKTEDDSIPLPHEHRYITKSGWEKHKDYLMIFNMGDRPNGWWLYEKNMEPPPKYHQAYALFEWGELQGAELQQCLHWWRLKYEDANQLPIRSEYWQWREIPPKLIKQWDRERQHALDLNRVPASQT